MERNYICEDNAADNLHFVANRVRTGSCAGCAIP
jgi:hypothetical protein